jgi:pyruvate,water dikinase
VTTISDVTHAESAPTRYWTSANIGEATPDVLSPLCWSFWGPQAEGAARRSYHAFGILSKRELAVPTDVNELMTGYFYGRPALNVDLLRPFFGSLPGVTADDFERDMCGKVRPGLPPASRKARLPIIVVRGVLAMRSTPKRQQALVPRQRAWWEREVRDRTDPGDPLTRLADAADHFRDAFEIHCCGRFVLMSAQATLAKLAIAVGRPELLLGLLAGLGGVTEVQLADDLWQVSRGRLTLLQFVDRHGFHGPNEGNLATRSWREDAGPVDRLVGSLAARPDDQRPATREAAAGAARLDAVEAFIAALPAKQRRRARKACDALVRSTQANELSKAAFLMAIDGGRAAARDHGRRLVAQGVLDDIDDVFFFTMAELSATPADAREVVAVRRQRREHYRTLELPVTFTGTPAPLRRGDTDDGDAVSSDDHRGGDILRGAAGSQGTVEGIARVVLDPNDAMPLEPGEVLVCRFTDPSWTPLFLLADALVIDIGGPASHGAIVARELGVPCVIGTGNGTHRIRSGDRVAVDGSTGVVTILRRAAGLPL